MAVRFTHVKSAVAVGVAVVLLAAILGLTARAAGEAPGFTLWALNTKTGLQAEQSGFSLDTASDQLLARSRGTRVAVATDTGLVLEDADDSGRDEIASGRPESAAFSSDGSSIAYTSLGCPSQASPDCTQLYVARSDGSALRLVASDASSPAWSPDGKTLAFVGAVGSDGFGRLLLEPATGGAPSDLGRSFASPPAFSPNGRRIAYACGNGLCIRDLGSAHDVDLRKLTKLPVTSSRYVLWSPNGRFLAVNTALNSDLGLAVVDLHRGTVRVLSGVEWLFESAVPLAWSPDSTTLLWGYRYNRTRIFETNVVTGRRVRVSHDDRQWYFARWTRSGITFLTYTGAFQPPY